MKGEWVKNAAGERIYAVSNAAVVVRNKSTVDKDLTKLENSVETHNENIADLKQIVQGNAWIILGKSYYGGEITIPAYGWVEEDNLFILEIENTQITETTMPIIAIAPESYSAALSCGLKSYCRTFDGKMILYAESQPVLEMVASIALIGENQAGRGLQVNSLTGKLGVDSDVVVVNDDLVDEENMNNDMTDWLNS